MKKEILIAIGITILFLVLPVTPLIQGTIIDKQYSVLISEDNPHIFYNKFKNFDYENDIYATKTDDVNFLGQSNESIYIVKVSNSNEITLDTFSVEIVLKTIGKKISTGAFCISCSVFDESIGGGLYPLMEVFLNEFDIQVKLRYLHFKLGEKINYTYENRTLYEFDNETLFSDNLIYPWSAIIPPGNWYFVFSSIIYDLDQTDVLSEWSVYMNFSCNCNDLNISTGEGGKVYGLYYGEFDANFIVSKANMLEMMVRGKANFHIENTFFYSYTSYPIHRGFWNVKWITPDGIKKFNMIIIRGNQFYDEDEAEGCIWGMGEKGDYELITSYTDYGRTIWGSGFAWYPIFVGLDLKLP